MTTPEQARWEARFVELGRRTLEALNDKTLAPPEATPYALQFYAAHTWNTPMRPTAPSTPW